MNKICTDCYYVGNASISTFNTEDNNFPIAGLIIGLGFMFFPIFIYPPLDLSWRSLNEISFQIICFVIAAYLLKGFFAKYDIRCPKCNSDSMVDIDSSDGQKIIKEQNPMKSEKVVGKLKICISCNQKGSEIRNTKSTLIWSIILIVLGILLFPVYIFKSVLNALGPIVWITFGLFMLITYLKNKNTCPYCKKVHSMIPLDTPRAQELIKQSTLTVPTNSQD